MTRFALRAGITLGILRILWMACEHLVGIRTTHLDWVEPSYGVYLLAGVPLTWLALFKLAPPSSHRLHHLFASGLLAGALSGMTQALAFWAYTSWINPAFLDDFIQWNVAHSSNTFEVANRAFRLPAFLDVLLGHPLLQSPVLACLLGRALRPKMT